MCSSGKHVILSSLQLNFALYSFCLSFHALYALVWRYEIAKCFIASLPTFHFSKAHLHFFLLFNFSTKMINNSISKMVTLRECLRIRNTQKDYSHRNKWNNHPTSIEGWEKPCCPFTRYPQTAVQKINFQLQGQVRWEKIKMFVCSEKVSHLFWKGQNHVEKLLTEVKMISTCSFWSELIG